MQEKLIKTAVSVLSAAAVAALLFGCGGGSGDGGSTVASGGAGTAEKSGAGSTGKEAGGGSKAGGGGKAGKAKGEAGSAGNDGGDSSGGGKPSGGSSGGGSEDAGGSGGSGSSDRQAGGKPAGGSSQFVKQASAICARAKKRASNRLNAILRKSGGSAAGSPEALGEGLRASYVPEFQAEIRAIRALGIPSSSKSQVEAFLASMQEVVASAESGPPASVVQLFSQGMQGPGKLARAAGLKACAYS